MFRHVNNGECQHPSFPRIRGDVPEAGTIKKASELFSPHTRGCSAGRAGRVFPPWVFPAYAGMFRLSRLRLLALTRFPRIRGDVPVA